MLAIIGFAAAFVITRYAFSEMLETVQQLSAPNEKLVRLNRVFEEITMLDQQQRAEVIKNPLKPYKYFLDQSGYVDSMIDSLMTLPWDSTQRKRLESLKAILAKRNESFVSYMKVKAELADNREFSGQLDTLTSLLRETRRKAPANKAAVQQQVTTPTRDTTTVAKENKSFIKRLFSRKKKNQVVDDIDVKTTLKTDTIAIAGTELDYEQFHKVMQDLERDQVSQRKRLQNRELELIHANSLFINSLLNTLHEVQIEEVQNVNNSNDAAAQVVEDGVMRINAVMISFVIGAALLVYFIFVDISKSNYYRRQLEKAKNEAEELSQIKQRFLSNMSHEIRTPLQSIIGFTEHLQQKHDDEAVRAIHSSSEHLLHIVNEVLDYSRISSGNFTLEKEPFDLFLLLREVESAMRVQATRKNIELRLETDISQPHFVLGDPFRLRQILYNLLGNAIKFTPSGSVKLTLFKESGTGLNYIFKVIDSGIGMTPEEVSKVFNQFEQANSQITKSFGGTGLGLSIVKALVEVQAGRIDVVSSPGKGTTFTVVIPFEAAEAENVQPIEPTTPAGVINGKAMVVDDDQMILRLCSLILSKYKIQHVTFNDPLKAAANVDEGITHVFIDVRMPQMSGPQLCRVLKEKLATNVRFTALTAHVLPEERQKLLDEGFDQVLPKPFHERDLVAAFGISFQGKEVYEHKLDFPELKKMTMGDEELFNSILTQFVDESDDDLGRLHIARHNNNTLEVREIVHKLAGRVGQIGIVNIAAKWRDIEERLIKTNSLASVEKDLQAAMKETDYLLNGIRSTEQPL